MKIKFAGKWYEVAMVQYNFGKPYYEIYDEPDTDPEHTDWITHPEEVIDDDGENSSFNTVSNIETKHQPTENSNDEILRIFNMKTNELYEYLKHEWIFHCHKKYHYLFDTWYENITDTQILYFNSWMNGKKTPW